MLKRFSFIALLSLGFASAAWADPALMVPVTINTSSIAGTNGSLDFNFNPGPLTSQSASLEITGFTGGTLDGTPFLTGDATGGPLPGSVVFSNGSAFNDYFQDFTFGSTLSFELLLSGPAVTSPDGTSTSGSTFAFSMYSDSMGTIPTLTTDLNDGFAVTVDINTDGSVSSTDYSSQATVGAAQAVPEPASFLLLGPVFAVILVAFRFARKPEIQPDPLHARG